VSDIVDNRREKLVDTIGRILDSTQSARFAVGYFFVSGLTAVQEKLEDVKELRLLIGNTSNRETIEQMAEGYRRLEMVAGAAEEQLYQKGAEARRLAGLAAREVGDALEVMDQTDEGERLVKTLVRLIEFNRLKVRVYTRGRLHSKAYIFDYEPDGRFEKGIAVVGSSNFTLSGISHNTELNVVVHGNDNHAELGAWFEELWDEAEEFDASLMEEMQRSWAVAPATPHDVYMKTLYALVRDRLEGEERARVAVGSDITDQLADFQRVAFRQAVGMIEERGGAFVSDVVGLGKSYIGAAIVSHFERTERARPLIVCPKPLVEMWERYNEVYQLNARVPVSCERAEPALPVPAGYNPAVMRVKERFEREVRERRAERENRRSRNRGQRYVRRELQVLFAGTEDAALRERINALERPFGGPLVSAVERRLNGLQRGGVKGEELLRELEGIYFRYRMYETASRPSTHREEDDTPRIVCSEALK
jgi:HKD family nuclease